MENIENSTWLFGLVIVICVGILLNARVNTHNKPIDTRMIAYIVWVNGSARKFQHKSEAFKYARASSRAIKKNIQMEIVDLMHYSQTVDGMKHGVLKTYWIDGSKNTHSHNSQKSKSNVTTHKQR